MCLHIRYAILAAASPHQPSADLANSVVVTMDGALFDAINGLAGHHRVLDGVMALLASAGPYALMATLLVLWFLRGARGARDLRQRAVLHATLATVAALWVNQAILRVWSRPRPFAVRAAVMLLERSGDPSFPSDHATFSFAVAVALFTAFRGLGCAALVLATLIGFARVFAGEHYVGDVLGGAAIGAVAALATMPAMPRVERSIAPLLRLARRIHLA